MAESVLTLFRRTALKLENQPCLLFKANQRWQSLSWADAEEKVRRLSLGLVALGVRSGDTVALLSQTRMEWTLIDLAIMACQGVTVPIYPTLSPDQAAYILQDANVSLVVVENRALWEPVAKTLKNFSRPIIFIDGESSGVLSFSELLEKGKSIPVNRYDENLKQIKPTATATLVYTSGTTGPPKGAILTHRNLTAEVTGLQEVFPFTAETIGMMCLPLAHVIARAMQFFALAQGCQTAYAESLEQLPENLREVRPHFMAAVPRLLEKSHEKILNRLNQSPYWLRRLFFTGLRLGQEINEARQKQQPLGLGGKILYQALSLLLFRKVRAGFGGRLRMIISGGAPLAKELAQFFHVVGILVIEGYGLTETSAAVTLNRLDDFRFGTIGKPLEGIRVKIAEDGEICVKGDTVFAGYLGAQSATEQAFDSEGWFLTGDIGEFTKDGFLKITDRKKDIIVTSSGKNIAPQNIENCLTQSPYIQQVMVYGDRQKFLSALVTLNWEAIENFAGKSGVAFASKEALAQNEKVVQLIQEEIDKRNQTLSRFESIKKFAILPANFSIESGELTPTMKVKRKVVTEKYKTILESFYQS